jgi:hypothetical protein
LALTYASGLRLLLAYKSLLSPLFKEGLDLLLKVICFSYLVGGGGYLTNFISFHSSFLVPEYLMPGQARDPIVTCCGLAI